MLNESILQSIDELEDVQLESKMLTYESMTENLIKEYFLEQAEVFQEGGGNHPRRARLQDNLRDDGRVPTLQRIANWFRRMVTTIRTYFSRHAINRLLRSIRNSARYQENDDFEGLLVDHDWYHENVHEPYVRISNIINRYFDRIVNTNVTGHQELTANMMRIFTSGRTLERDLQRIANMREDLHDTFNEVRSITSVNTTHRRQNNWDHTGPGEYPDTTIARRRERLTKANLDRLLDELANDSDSLTEQIRQLNSSIDNVRQMAEAIGNQNLNVRQDATRISEQFVKFITDSTRVLMYMVQINVKTAQRLQYSLGANKMKREEEDE